MDPLIRWSCIPAILVLALGLPAAHAARRQPATAAPLSPATRANLERAMQGEALAYARYTLDAEVARRSGNAALARLFEDTARIERFEHFAEEARLARVVGDNRKNLRDAIQGESYEAGTMYPGFARQARAAGDTAAARLFSEIGRDEAKHRAAFAAALRKLQP
jgi:rubrerythrin